MEVFDIKETGNITEEMAETLYATQLKMYRDCISECPNNRWHYGVDVGDGEDHNGYIGIFDGKVVPLPKDEIR